jgi:hypothetical protein
MYDSIISLKGEIWAHKPSLILPPFIEVPVPSHEMVCAISIDVVSFSYEVDKILELLRQCGIFEFFSFSIYSY